MEVLVGALVFAAAWTVFFSIIGWLEDVNWKFVFQFFVAPVALGLAGSQMFPSESHPIGWPIGCAVGTLVVWAVVCEEWAKQRSRQVLDAKRNLFARSLNNKAEPPKRYTDAELKAAIEKAVKEHKAREPREAGTQPQPTRRDKDSDSERTPAVVAKSVRAAPLFAVGELVFHQKFGNGHITAMDGNRLTIQFDTVGVRRVVDSFVERT